MTTPTYEQMRDMFRAHTEAAVKVIVDIMSGTGGKGDAVRLSAAKEVLTRGWGKPVGQDKKAKKDREPDPDYRGKSLMDILEDEAAAAGKEVPWAKALAEHAARAAAAPPPAAEPATATTTPAAPPLPPPAARNDDPTGYKARRALWSGPAPAGR